MNELLKCHLRILGALPMIKDRIDRRVAIITVGGLLATTATLFTWNPFTPDASRTQSGGGLTYEQPTWWDGYSKAEKTFFLAWDRVFFQSEALSPAPSTAPGIGAPFNAAGALMLSFMSAQGQDLTKRRLAVFVADSRRNMYLPHLEPALDVTRSDATTRTTILGTYNRIARRSGGAAFTTEVRQALLSRFSVEPDQYVLYKFDQLLSTLKIPH